MPDPMTVFDRRTVRRRRDRAAARLADHDFLYREIGDRLCDRLEDIRRTFPMALDLGCHTGTLASQIAGRGGIDTLVHCDLAPGMAAAAPRPAVAADEELLPFADGAFDLVLSALSLHWVNDLPGALSQIRRALRPDGLFLAAMFGGKTLKELRHVLADAEIAGEGGLSPRVSPFVEVRDAGNLLQRAGFALPVADAETITVTYRDPLRLLGDLRGMGEANAAIERRKQFTRRTTVFDALARYRDHYADDDGRLPVTVEVIYLTAWAPDPSQPKPLRRGSARTSLAAALATPGDAAANLPGTGEGTGAPTAMANPETAEDQRIAEVAAQLRTMKQTLGDAFWQDDEVRRLQQSLRQAIGEYGAWGEARLPMHQRARVAARLESENADLLWPGRAAGG